MALRPTLQIFAGIAAGLLLSAAGNSDQVAAQDLATALRIAPQNYYLVDVRTAAEFRAKQGRVEGTRNLPYPGLMWRLDELEPTEGQVVVLICRSAHRSRLALPGVRKKLSSFSVVELEGGMQSWWDAGLPLVREQP